MNLLNKINLPVKCLILGLFAMFCFTHHVIYSDGKPAYRHKQQELSGVPLEKHLLKLLQRHRAETAIAIALRKPDNPPRIALMAEINRLSDFIQSELRKQDASAQPLQRLNKMGQAWMQLQSGDGVDA